MNRIHVRKLEHHNWPLVMFTFQHLHLCASGDKLSAKATVETYDGFHICLILRFILDRVLNDEIGSISKALAGQEAHVSMRAASTSVAGAHRISRAPIGPGSAHVLAMSLLSPKANVSWRERHVRFVPERDIGHD
jgi:hypothetical protein